MVNLDQHVVKSVIQVSELKLFEHFLELSLLSVRQRRLLFSQWKSKVIQGLDLARRFSLGDTLDFCAYNLGPGGFDDFSVIVIGLVPVRQLETEDEKIREFLTGLCLCKTARLLSDVRYLHHWAFSKTRWYEGTGRLWGDDQGLMMLILHCWMPLGLHHLYGLLSLDWVSIHGNGPLTDARAWWRRWWKASAGWSVRSVELDSSVLC
jgi:hypothetical protein